MIPTQTFDEFPEFANSGTKTAPDDAKYAAGFIPADVLPAEWANYFFSGSTKGITDLNSGLSSVETEMNNVLTNRGITASESTNTQLLEALQSFKAEAILASHPIGSLYWTSKNENPSVTFGGGTWSPITDKFVLAAGSTYTNGATGGNATVTLVTANLPSHTHTMSHTHGYTPSGTVSSHSHTISHTHGYTPSGTVSSHSHTIAHTHSFTPEGTISSHSHTMSHTHSFTPSGTISAHTHTIAHTHTYSGTTADMSSTNDNYEGSFVSTVTTSSDATGFVTISQQSSNIKIVGDYNRAKTTVSMDVDHSHTYSGTTSASSNANSGSTTPTFTGTAGTTGASSASSTGSTTPTFTGTAGTTGGVSTANSGSTQPTFTGSAGTTSSISTTSSGSTTPTFTGTAGTTTSISTSSTGSTGSGSAVNIMPPYVVKYCWERTA